MPAQHRQCSINSIIACLSVSLRVSDGIGLAENLDKFDRPLLAAAGGQNLWPVMRAQRVAGKRVKEPGVRGPRRLQRSPFAEETAAAAQVLGHPAVGLGLCVHHDNGGGRELGGDGGQGGGGPQRGRRLHGHRPTPWEYY